VSPRAEDVTSPQCTPCVVDARLALSRHGQVAIARLARGFPVWIPRQLQRLLRDTGRYLEDRSTVGHLVPRPYCQSLRQLDMAAEIDAIGRELSQWDRLPEEDALASLPLHYVGDRADECALPSDVDRQLRERCEQLQRGLYCAMTRSGYDLPRGEIVSECIADAVALCAALEPYGAFILTRLEADGQGNPVLCDYLDAWGVPVAEAPVTAEPAGRWLAEALGRCGMSPITWAGIPLVAVHVLVAGFPVLGHADKGLDDDAVAGLWADASVMWHRV
jgi:hypothetical protein